MLLAQCPHVREQEVDLFERKGFSHVYYILDELEYLYLVVFLYNSYPGLSYEIFLKLL